MLPLPSFYALWFYNTSQQCQKKEYSFQGSKSDCLVMPNERFPLFQHPVWRTGKSQGSREWPCDRSRLARSCPCRCLVKILQDVLVVLKMAILLWICDDLGNLGVRGNCTHKWTTVDNSLSLTFSERGREGRTFLFLFQTFSFLEGVGRCPVLEK